MKDVGYADWAQAKIAREARADEERARAVGWFPTREAHVLFEQSKGVCRYLKSGEKYNEETDSLVSSPLRHADSWAEACAMDGLV